MEETQELRANSGTPELKSDLHDKCSLEGEIKILQLSVTGLQNEKNSLLNELEELKKQHKEMTESRDAIRKELCDLRTALAKEKEKGQSKEESAVKNEAGSSETKRGVEVSQAEPPRKFIVTSAVGRTELLSPVDVNHLRVDVRLTLLHLAVERGFVGEVRALLNAGESTRILDQRHRTPLHLALECGREDVAELLSEADGINCLQDEEGRTPLHLAAEEGYVGVVKKLLNAGASTRILDRHHSTPLHVALECRREDVAELLSEADGMNCLQDEEGRTPLHLAAERGYVGVLEKLLNAGASTRIQDRHHSTPLHLALKSREKEAAELLSDADSNICLQDVKGRTPLPLALRVGYDSIARRLLYSLAHTPLVDNGILPPLTYLSRDGRRRLLLLLVPMASLKKDTVVWNEVTLDPGDRALCSSLAAECNAEVRRMRETSVPGSSASFYDVARRPAGWVAARLRDDGFREALRERAPFPRYVDLIRFRAAAADRRRILEDRCLRRFALLDRRLPEIAVDGIFPYLTERDMENFATAFVRKA